MYSDLIGRILAMGDADRERALMLLALDHDGGQRALRVVLAILDTANAVDDPQE
jgi:hypothetical protein